MHLLYYRVKARKDKFELTLPDRVKIAVTFEIADDVNGRYDVVSVEPGYLSSKAKPIVHTVTALRFNKSDIKSLFQIAEETEARP